MTDRAPGDKPGPSARREDRYRARSILWRHSSLDRVRACGRYAQATASAPAVGMVDAGGHRREGVAAVVRRDPVITLKVSDVDGVRSASWGGVQSCGSTWSCPVCAEAIQARRQLEVATALAAAAARGWVTAFITFTIRHRRTKSGRLIPLKSCWDAVSAGWRSATSGSRAAWRDDRADYGIKGYVRLTEVTYGHTNGWHVHVHALVFLDPRSAELSRANSAGATSTSLQEPFVVPGGQTARALHLAHAEALGSSMFARWSRAVTRQSVGFRPSKRRGVDVRLVVDERDLAGYFAKNIYSVKSAGSAAFDVTGSHAKQARHGNVTPFGLLDLFVSTGDLDVLDRWWEWEQASKGRRQLVWSRGLRAELGLVEDEDDDETIANEDPAGAPLLDLAPQAFRQLADAGALAALLAAAERDPSGDAVRFILLDVGVAWTWSGAPPGSRSGVGSETARNGPLAGAPPGPLS